MSRIRLATLAFAVFAMVTESRAQQADLDHSIWHLKTTLWDDDDVPDLVMIKKRPSGTGSTEVHIYSGSSKYRSPLVEVGTPLPYTDEKWEFAVADWNLDGVPDLWAICRDGDHHKVEVNILSGAMFFRQFLLRAETSLEAVGPEVEFLAIPPIRAAAARPNLMLVRRERTASHMTELQVLDGGSDFKKTVIETGTALPETGTGPTWQFQAGDFNGDRVLDLIAVTSEGDGALYVVDGKADLRSFALHVQTGGEIVKVKLNAVAPGYGELEEAAISKMEDVAADPLVPAGVGPRTALMGGTYGASAIADLYSGRSVSQAIRRFQKAAASEGLADELKDGPISARLEIVSPEEDRQRAAKAAKAEATKGDKRSDGHEYRVAAVEEDLTRLAEALERFDGDGWEVVGTIGNRSVILKRPRRDQGHR